MCVWLNGWVVGYIYVYTCTRNIPICKSVKELHLRTVLTEKIHPNLDSTKLDHNTETRAKCEYLGYKP